MIRTHTISQVLPETTGTRVTLGGWVHAIRHLGKLSFVELRDSSGMIQLSFIGGETSAELMEMAASLRPEAVILVTGTVRARPVKKRHDPDSAQDTLEIGVAELEIINQPESLPFEVSTDTMVPNRLKLKYRQLYLRRQRLQRNIALRSRAFQFLRAWLVERGFHEIETPILFKATVGGAREFIVPTRSHPGKFYVLRQSPQQLKQILMASGFERYFQICKLFHDSYTRSERPPEFTALDMEVAFADEVDIMGLMEGMICDLVGTVTPELEVILPIARVTYADCLLRFGTSAPDLRLAIEAIPLALDTEAAQRLAPGGGPEIGPAFAVRIPRRVAVRHEQDILRLLLNEGVREINRLYIDMDRKWDETAAGSPDGVAEAVRQSGLTELRRGDLVLFLAGEEQAIAAAVGACRDRVAEQIDSTEWSRELVFLWVVDQPFFRRDPATGRWKLKHQPFTHPKNPGTLYEEASDLGEVLGREYALVCNGDEIGGGSVRIHKADLQRRIFQLVGLGEAEIEFYFGHLLQALTSGAPPHAGATFSLDTLIKLLARERFASEVVPFPKLGNGIDPLTDAPSELDEETLEMFKLKLLTDAP